MKKLYFIAFALYSVVAKSQFGMVFSSSTGVPTTTLNTTISSVTIDNSNNIYAFVHSYSGSTYNNDIYKSTDGGNTFSGVGSFVSSQTTLLDALTFGSTFFVTGGNTSVLTSTNTGTSWTISGFNGSDAIVGFVKIDNQTALAYCTNITKLYRTTNGGATWTPQTVSNAPTGFSFWKAFKLNNGDIMVSYQKSASTSTYIAMGSTTGGASYSYSITSTSEMITNGFINSSNQLTVFTSAGTSRNYAVSTTTNSYISTNTTQVDMSLAPVDGFRGTLYNNSVFISAINSSSGNKVVKGTVPTATFTNTGVFEISENDQVNAFPNPTSGILNISVKNNNDNFEYEIFDQVGSMLFSGKSNSSIDIGTLAPGIYILRIGSTSKRIIKTN